VKFANFNIHLHGLVLDGVYRSTGDDAQFQKARAPTRAELEGLLDKIIARLLKMLTRLGYLVEEQGVILSWRLYALPRTGFLSCTRSELTQRKGKDRKPACKFLLWPSSHRHTTRCSRTCPDAGQLRISAYPICPNY
jgi:hypothetical protein